MMFPPFRSPGLTGRRISWRTLTATAALACGCLGVSGCAQRAASSAAVAAARASGPIAMQDAQVPIPGAPAAPNGPSTPETPEAPSVEPTFPAGTTVAGVDVGGKTAAEAGHAVRLALQSMAARKITLRYGQKVYPRTWRELGIAPDTEAMLQQAWTETEVPLKVAVSLGEAKRSIRRAARALDIRPVAPRFAGEPGKSQVIPGKTGRRVDVYASALLLQKKIAENMDAGESPLVVLAAEPPFTAEDMEQIRQPVVTFSTRYNAGERDRTYNLRLVAKRLNGALIPPGATFSFNDWVGERKPSEGFREAIVYKQGKMVRDTGGGLCQVSSTLYNVALLAGLPIVERSHHSLTVAYVPLGRDATVYWGQHDLRFRNDTDGPLYIRTRTGRGRLTIEAWGDAPLDRKVSVTNRVAHRGDQAFARVFRTITEDGRSRSEQLSSDSYSTVHTMAAPPGRRG